LPETRLTDQKGSKEIERELLTVAVGEANADYGFSVVSWRLVRSHRGHSIGKINSIEDKSTWQQVIHSGNHTFSS